jgi:hypothetical protein
MVHFNISPQLKYEQPEVHNDPCQHAFILVGLERIYGVHMTQYHCEKHKYQLILHFDLPKEAREEYLRQRDLYPDDTFILCNRIEDKCSIPSLGGFEKKEFTGAIYRGFRPPPDPEPEGWFPWNDNETLPVINKIKVKIRRVVLWRPFAHHEYAPDTASYFMWGHKEPALGHSHEAHMTNLQTAELLTGPHEVSLYGLDQDHVMSLDHAPEWVSGEMLNAGIVVSVPSIPRRDPETGDTMLLPKPPFDKGDTFQVMYRGIQPPRHVKAGQTFLWASMVCNSPALVPVTPNMELIISPMPEKYWL